MGVMTRAFKSLLPPGSPWRLPAVFRSVIEALALSLDRLKAFIDAIVTESLPSSADDTLAEWYAMLGLPYDATQTLSTRQDRARQAYTAVGGQALDYLNELIQIAFPDVELELVTPFIDPNNMVGYGETGRIETVSYPSWLTVPPTDGSYPYAYYRVIGEVPDVTDLNRITGLLDRVAPAEMEPVFAVTVANLTATAQVGLGMVGLMEVGRE